MQEQKLKTTYIVGFEEILQLKKSSKIALIGIIIAVILWVSDYIYGTYIYRSAGNFYFSLIWFIGILVLIVAWVLSADEKSKEEKERKQPQVMTKT